jgi:hypothetical protein
MNKREPIHQLFIEAGILFPTYEQITLVQALLDKTVKNIVDFLRDSIQKVETMERWRGSQNTLSIKDTV